MEIAAFVISLAALFTATLAFANEYTHGRRQFILEMYQGFLEVDQQNGRRRLFEVAEEGLDVSQLPQSDVDQINHSLAYLNLVGYMYAENQIPRGDALRLMGRSAGRLLPTAIIVGFLGLRDEHHGGHSLAYFRLFAEEANNLWPSIKAKEDLDIRGRRFRRSIRP